MKLQCDVCAQAAAWLFCCADEAALCAECDIRVHAANKLAGKHHRLPLITPDRPPSSCDICQEKKGLFFCVEDRALLCRDCDVTIHTANKLTRKHKRFLVSGIKVEPNAMTTTCLSSEVASSHRTKVVVGLDRMASPPSKVASPHQPSIVVGLNTMAPQLTSPLLNESSSKDKFKASISTMESTHHVVAHLTTMQPSILELDNITPKDSPPHLKPHPPLSRPSNLETTNTFTSHSSSPFEYPFNCLVQLDDILNASPTSITFNETPLMMSMPNVGWSALDSSFAENVLHESANLFEKSVAQVPSTPTTHHAPCFQGSLSKSKRHLDETFFYTVDHTLLVPNSIFPQRKQRRINF